MLVDADNRSLRVLEVSLRKAGFEVLTAESAAAALQLALQNSPDLVITEVQLPDYDGFELCQRLRNDQRTANCAVVFLTERTGPEVKISGINVGADEFLTKPVLVKEIISRVRALVDDGAPGSRRERPGNLSGTLANMGVVDLLQVMEAGSKSGIVHLSSDPIKSGGFVAEGEERGTLFFRDGEVIDARLGRHKGLDAVYRMLLWDDGVFEIEFKQISRPDALQTPTQQILLEGMRRVDEWSHFSELLPPVNSKLTVDYGALGRAFARMPPEMKPVLHLFDGRRTLFEVVSDAPGEDITALEVVADLHRHNVLVNAGSDTPNTDDVEAWLSQGAEPASQVGEPVPSALGRAVIPSAHTPSEILSAASLDEIPREETLIARDAYPEDPGTREPSLILSRHTVPANKAVPLTAPPAQSEPIPLTQPSKSMKLKISRVSSVVASSLITRRPAEASSTPSPASDIEMSGALRLRDEEDGWGVIKTSPSHRSAPDNDPTLTEFPSQPSAPGAFDPVQTNGQRPPARAQAALHVATPSSDSQRSISSTSLVPRDPRPSQTPSRPEPTADSIARAQSSYVIAPAAPPNWPVGNEPRDPNQPPPGAIPSTQTQTALVPARQFNHPPEPEASLAVDQAPTAEPAAVVQTPSAPQTRELSDPRAEAAAKEPTEPQAARSESSNFSDDWYQAKSAASDEMLWESENPWKQRALAIALVVTVVAVLGVLLVGGNKHKEEPPTVAKNEKTRAEWPKSPAGEVKVESTKPAAVAAAPVAPSTPTPSEGAAAKTPEGQTPPTPPTTPASPTPKAGEPAIAKAITQTPKTTESGAPAAPVKAPEKAPAKVESPEKAPTPAADPKKAQAQLAKAERSLASGSLKSARRAFQAALKADPQSAKAHAGLAMVYVEQGKDRSAKASAWRALKIDRGQARAHLVLGLVASNAQDNDAAKRSYRRYLRLNPKGKHASEVRRVLESL